MNYKLRGSLYVNFFINAESREEAQLRVQQLMEKLERETPNSYIGEVYFLDDVLRSSYES